MLEGGDELSEKTFTRDLIVKKHRTVEKSGEDPVYEVIVKSILKDEATKTEVTLKITTESEAVKDKFCLDEQFTVKCHKQPKIG